MTSQIPSEPRCTLYSILDSLDKIGMDLYTVRAQVVDLINKTDALREPAQMELFDEHTLKQCFGRKA